jgi:hypothetical protein
LVKEIPTAKELAENKTGSIPFKYAPVNPNKLKIYERECMATFAGENELVVVLKDTETKLEK